MRNRLYRVRDGEHIVFPEIPCSIDTPASFGAHVGCVVRSLVGLTAQDVIAPERAVRFFRSAVAGYLAER